MAERLPGKTVTIPKLPGTPAPTVKLPGGPVAPKLQPFQGIIPTPKIIQPPQPKIVVPIQPLQPKIVVPVQPTQFKLAVPTQPLQPKIVVPVQPTQPKLVVPTQPTQPKIAVPTQPAQPKIAVPGKVTQPIALPKMQPKLMTGGAVVPPPGQQPLAGETLREYTRRTGFGRPLGHAFAGEFGGAPPPMKLAGETDDEYFIRTGILAMFATPGANQQPLAGETLLEYTRRTGLGRPIGHTFAGEFGGAPAPMKRAGETDDEYFERTGILAMFVAQGPNQPRADETLHMYMLRTGLPGPPGHRFAGENGGPPPPMKRQGETDAQYEVRTGYPLPRAGETLREYMRRTGLPGPPDHRFAGEIGGPPPPMKRQGETDAQYEERTGILARLAPPGLAPPGLAPPGPGQPLVVPFQPPRAGETRREYRRRTGADGPPGHIFAGEPGGAPPPRKLIGETDVQYEQRTGLATQPPKFTPQQIRERIAARRAHALATGKDIDLTYKAGHEQPPHTALQYAHAIKYGHGRDWNGHDIIGHLMSKDNVLLPAVMQHLGFQYLHSTIDQFYAIIWYLIYVRKTTLDQTLLAKPEETEYVSGLSVEELLQLLGPTYTGPRDISSLMITALTGKQCALPDIANIPRYNEVMRMPPERAWLLASKVYNIIDKEAQIVSEYHPYKHVALQQPSLIESIVSILAPQNVDAIMQKYGIVLPPHTNEAHKLDYVMNTIVKYRRVFERPANLLPPPRLQGLTRAQIKDALSEYTDKELIQAYEPVREWNDRDDLITIIRDELEGGSTWSWRHRFCNNDTTENVVESELHGNIDKDDAMNPTLSYGVQGNYRCYQVTELEANFRLDEDETFIFFVPDWKPNTPGDPTPIDPITGETLVREFTTASMRELKRMLENAAGWPPGADADAINALLRKIQEGLETYDNLTKVVKSLRDTYHRSSPEQQDFMKMYLGWLFYYGMWMRFWKGPGTPLPMRWIEGGGGEALCRIEQRDVHTSIQGIIKSDLEIVMDTKFGLKEWREKLPLVEYNFRTRTARGSTKSITYILERIMMTDFCLPHGSDLVSQTAYYLIVNILEIPDLAAFNRFLADILPPLLNEERIVVGRKLQILKQARAEQPEKDRLNPPKDKYYHGEFLRMREEEIQTYQTRLDALMQPIPPLKPFDPGAMTITHHRDPWHGHNLFEGDE